MNTVTKIHAKPSASIPVNGTFSSMTMNTVAETGSMLASILATTGPHLFIPIKYSVYDTIVPSRIIKTRSIMNLGFVLNGCKNALLHVLVMAPPISMAQPVTGIAPYLPISLIGRKV